MSNPRNAQELVHYFFRVKATAVGYPDLQTFTRRAKRYLSQARAAQGRVATGVAEYNPKINPGNGK